MSCLGRKLKKSCGFKLKFPTFRLCDGLGFDQINF